MTLSSILSISKLDSKLLLITPVPVQPVEVVRQVQQMFIVECEKVHDIKMRFQINESYRALNVDIVMLDSSRLLQVLINLMVRSPACLLPILTTYLRENLSTEVVERLLTLASTRQTPSNSPRLLPNAPSTLQLARLETRRQQNLRASNISQQTRRDQTSPPEAIGATARSCSFDLRYWSHDAEL